MRLRTPLQYQEPDEKEIQKIEEAFENKGNEGTKFYLDPGKIIF